MRALTPKRAAQEAERRRVVKLARQRDGNRCQAPDRLDGVTISLKGAAALPARCFGILDPHEVIPKSAWLAGRLVLDNVVIVCRAHHDWIGDYPDDAWMNGRPDRLHGYSWERPDATPLPE